MKKPRILFVTSRGMPPEHASKITAGIDGAEFAYCPDTLEAIQAALPDIHGLLNCPRKLFSPDILSLAGDTLRWVHLGGAGCEEFMIPEFVESDIVFTNGRIIQGPEVADHALALLLSLARNIHLVLRNASASQPRPLELYRKTMLVIGVGGIGLLVAERARAFGMKVLAADEDYVPMVSAIERFIPLDRLSEGLAASDVVVMAAPNTPRSMRMMATPQFAAMKRAALYVSVSRGANTDTEALLAALRAKTIAGAGLDVTDPEPLPADHPLRSMDNVIITPHIAGLSDYNRERSATLMRANIQRFVRNEPLYNVVDKARGY